MKMKIKTDLVFLGFVRRIQYKDFRQSLNTVSCKFTEKIPTKTDKKILGLFVTSDAKTLYFIPWSRPVIMEVPKGLELHKKVFRRWANQPANQAINIWIPKLKNLSHVGYIEEIEYTSDKFERAGDDGKFNLYMHKFKTKPAIYVNCPLRPYMWGVADPDERKIMTYRGIVL